MNQVLKRMKELAEQGGSLLGRLPTKQVDIGLAILVTLAAVTFYSLTVIGGRQFALFSFVRNIELRSLDARFLMRGPRDGDSRIAIIGIDEKTLQKIGAYPIPRDAYAKMIDRLAAGGARIISFDVAFPTPEKNSAVEALAKLQEQIQGKASPEVIEQIRQIQASSDNDKIFAESLQKAGNVIIGHLFLDAEQAKAMNEAAAEDYYNILWGKPFPQVIKAQGSRDFDMNRAWIEHGGIVAAGVESNIRLLAEAARSYGAFDIAPDPDGTVRRSNLLIRYRDRDWFPSLALQTIREYENIKDQSIECRIAENGMERIIMGPYEFHTEPDASVLINFAGPFGSYRHYSMADVIDGTVPASTFKDKIVFLGATAKAIGDLRSTPFQKQDQGYMGVEIHANVIDNMLHQNERGRGFLHRGTNEEMIDIAIILIFGLGMGWWFGRTKPLYATVGVVLALILFGMTTQFAFSKLGMWLSVVIPAGTLVINYASITSFRMITEEREKRKVRKTFERYVSPGVISLIEKDPKKYFKTGGEMKELSIMFSDIRSFTTISEGLTPDQLVHLLNEYLGEMTDLIFKRWGTLDKYIGDAIMAFWGSPYPQDDHHIRSCTAALDMSARLDELNMKWEAQGQKQLSIGIGINSGPVNVGNMGSSKRFSWTVMGDHVNLASRLEGQTKDYHVRTIISEFTHGKVKDHFVCRELDWIKVKGKNKPVGIYQLLAAGKDAAKYQDRLTMFADALAVYRAGRFDEALQKFEATLAKYPDDGPSEVFWKRCQQFLAETPAAWDGVFTATSK